MKTIAGASVCCSSYYDLRMNRLALIMLLCMCQRRGWLCKPAGFERVFDIHMTNIYLYWNRLYIEELVIMIMLLIVQGYIVVRGEHGKWKVLEKHLLDFEGNPISDKLGDIQRHILKDPDAHKGKLMKIMEMISVAVKRHPRKK